MSGDSKRRRVSRTALLAGFLALLLGGYLVGKIVSPQYRFCDACDATGAVACGAPGCDRGAVTCTGDCLRKDTPGWHSRNVPGFPPETRWMKFTDADDQEVFVSQAHLGQIMESRNGRWVLLGRCPVCRGSTRMPCPSCQGKRLCPACHGKGKTRKWL